MSDILKILNNKSQHDPVFMIAELGINHDGDLSIAKKMIDASVEAKADAVKFQIYNIDEFYNQSLAPDAYNLFKSFQINLDDFKSLRNYAEKKGILAFATPLDISTFSDLMMNKIYPIKIASGDAGTEPWIDLLLEQNIPFIISTGSLEHAEIEALAHKINGSLSAMLYCVSQYPAPPEGFDLRYLNTMQKMLPNQRIGFSDHSEGIALSLGAVAQGAAIIERHFTLFPERTDLDHPLSLSPEQFYDMVVASRKIEAALGKGIRQNTPIEQKIKSLAGRDAYAKTLIPANTPITEQHIILQRPGSGISTKNYKSLIGQTYNQDIQKGQSLQKIFFC
ncbi:MAG: N-acetylneuraminate synthase family protein [Brevinema sp.]